MKPKPDFNTPKEFLEAVMPKPPVHVCPECGQEITDGNTIHAKCLFDKGIKRIGRRHND